MKKTNWSKYIYIGFILALLATLAGGNSVNTAYADDGGSDYEKKPVTERSAGPLYGDDVAEGISASAGNLLSDPSFEAYTPNASWIESSTHFGTPLCTVGDCGDGGGTAGPRTGSVWAWFGGTNAYEQAALMQDVTFPVTSATLQFYLRIFSGSGSDASDTFSVFIDGNEVFSVNATHAASYSQYTFVSIPLPEYGDGQSHRIAFVSVSDTSIGFHMDDVALVEDSSFVDVSTSHWAWPYIEAFYNEGITTGCRPSPLAYCPDNRVTRAEMAVFIERALWGSGFTPTPRLLSFTDTSSHWAKYWIEAFLDDGITTGCGPSLYCPDQYVTRAEMAVFIERALQGGAYTPPVVALTFADTSSHWAKYWIERFKSDGITTGCGYNTYCPDQYVTRAEMAVFLSRAFGYDLP